MSMIKHFSDDFEYPKQDRPQHHNNLAREINMSIMDKLKKNSKLPETEVMSKSKFFLEVEKISIDVPMLNVALSGSLDGGLTQGLTVLAGPSKHFKTSFALKIAAAYLDSDPEAVILFYDSEFGSPQSYFENFGIDPSRVLHTPITNIEELKFDVVTQLEGLDRKDKVIIVIDSIGNLASKKEIEDAKDEKSVADMTRAKHLKGLFRMVTPYLAMKNIPMLAINHTYQTMEMFSKAVVSGGTGIYYSASNIWILGRRQNKTGTEVTGYDFVINAEKSRYIKEKSKIPISVSWDGGIEKYSGLLEVALAGGFVVKPSNGWYNKVDLETGEVVGTKVREKDTKTDEFWGDILSNQKFKDFVHNLYSIDKKTEVVVDLEEILEYD